MNYAQHFDKLNPKHSPIVNTDYYRWLGGHYNDNSITNILGYLNDRFGFVKGIDTINSRSIETHNYISDLYFRNKIAPKLKKRINSEISN